MKIGAQAETLRNMFDVCDKNWHIAPNIYEIYAVFNENWHIGRKLKKYV